MLTEKEVVILKQMIEIEISYLDEQITERHKESEYVKEMEKRIQELKAIESKLSDKTE